VTEFSEEIARHLEEVMVAYGGHSALDLERLTHSEPPWREARGDLPPDENSEAPISEETMRRYYRSIAADGER